MSMKTCKKISKIWKNIIKEANNKIRIKNKRKSKNNNWFGNKKIEFIYYFFGILENNKLNSIFIKKIWWI
jgi:hypothetical protein